MNRVISLPYGDEEIEVSIPEEKLMGVFTPRSLPAAPDPAACLREAMARPVGSPPLREKARGTRQIAIVVEDISRPVEVPLLLDAVMAELEAADVERERVRVIVALGLHRPLTDDELAATLGRWSGKISIENHDSRDPDGLVYLGETKLGTRISVNKTFYESDLKILTGDVEYHQFCGYGGGAKGVYPGMADAEAIRTNHSRMDLPGTGPGRIDGNSVREEVDEVGRMAGVDFNLSVAMDDHHRIVAACAGDPDRSFREMAKVIDRMYRVEAPGRPDFVIASAGGHPKDIDLYQAQKALEEASLMVKPGGDVALFARCEEGSGSKLFEEWMDAAFTAEEIVERIRARFVMGGHKAYQIAREVQRARLHMYSQIPPGRLRAWMMNPLRTIEDVASLVERAASVAVLPQATLTLIDLTEG